MLQHSLAKGQRYIIPPVQYHILQCRFQTNNQNYQPCNIVHFTHSEKLSLWVLCMIVQEQYIVLMGVAQLSKEGLAYVWVKSDFIKFSRRNLLSSSDFMSLCIHQVSNREAFLSLFGYQSESARFSKEKLKPPKMWNVEQVHVPNQHRNN